MSGKGPARAGEIFFNFSLDKPLQMVYECAKRAEAGAQIKYIRTVRRIYFNFPGERGAHAETDRKEGSGPMVLVREVRPDEMREDWS